MFIAVVDDEPLVLETLTSFLGHCGHRVVTAENARAIMEVLENESGQVDLLLSDVCMPGLSGTELIGELRERYPDIDVILMTGYAHSLDARSALELGAASYIRKPIKLAELEVVIQQIDEQRRTRCRLRTLDQNLQDERALREESIRDRMFARRLHSRIFPRNFNFLPRSVVHVRHLPMAGVGGDYIDVRPYGEDQALMIVADVSGHGVPAAFGGIALKTWFTAVELNLTPVEILERADDMMAEVFPEEFYATAFCAIYHEKTRNLSYALAGHPEPCLISCTSAPRLLSANGGALGMGSDQARELANETVGSDEILLAFTDGLTEDPGKILQMLSDGMDTSEDWGRALLDLPTFATWMLDRAVMADPLKAYGDDLSMLLLSVAKPKAEDPDVELNEKHVLLVDDDSEVLDFMQLTLDRLGLKVTQRTDAENILEDIAIAEPDVVVMDVVMPGRNGLEALSLIARHYPRLPVIIQSGYEGERYARLSLSAHATAFLSKPFTPLELQSAVQQALQYDPERDTIHFDDVCSDWMDFVISSSTASLDILSRYIAALTQQPLPPQVMEDVIYCIREIAGNAIEWGNLHNPDFHVRISTIVLPNQVMIKISDEGSGFDVRRALAGEDQADAQRLREQMGKRDGGFGLMIVKSLMDRVTFNEQGNSVLMVKSLHS